MSFNDVSANMNKSNDVFLFSDTTNNPLTFFQGYCFYKNDYIWGEDGGQAYYKENGVTIPAGEDGCYVSVIKEDESFVFKCDHHGYKKIFYFWNDGCWVVSNSLFLLTSHLKRRNITVIPNYSQLSAMSLDGMFFNQLTSFETVIKGVGLLPPGYSLRIGGSCPPRFDKVNKDHDHTGSYADKLKLFLDTWVSRMETLLCDPKVTITSDITGGVDSRSVLAMFIKAKKRVGKGNESPFLRCGSIAGDKSDIKVAKKICSKYSLNLNIPNKHKVNYYTSEERVDAWRNLCLGLYHPVYFPQLAPDPTLVHFDGAGGGNHRSVYDKNGLHNNIESFIENSGQNIQPSWLRYDFKSSLASSFAHISQEKPGSSYRELLIDHYRYFRNRFHAGRAPQYRVLFSPLGSHLLDSASLKLDERLKGSAQVNYDIIASLDLKLLRMEYDKPFKFPSEIALSNLTIVNVDSMPSPGKVYSGGNILVSNEQSNMNGKDAFSVLDSYLMDALGNGFVHDFWQEKYVEDTQSLSKKAMQNKGIRHAVDAVPIATLIASGMFFN